MAAISRLTEGFLLALSKEAMLMGFFLGDSYVGGSSEDNLDYFVFMLC